MVSVTTCWPENLTWTPMMDCEDQHQGLLNDWRCDCSLRDHPVGTVVRTLTHMTQHCLLCEWKACTSTSRSFSGLSSQWRNFPQLSSPLCPKPICNSLHTKTRKLTKIAGAIAQTTIRSLLVSATHLLGWRIFELDIRCPRIRRGRNGLRTA